MRPEAVPVWPPIAGTYAMKLTRGGPRVPVRIWHGLAEIDGEAQDRALGWFCEIDGKTDRVERDDDTGYRCRVPIEIDRAWPYAAGEPITEAEYKFLIADAAHAREWRPDHPKASPWRPVNFNTLPPRF